MAKKCIKNLVFAIVELFFLILIEAQANDTFFFPLHFLATMFIPLNLINPMIIAKA